MLDVGGRTHVGVAAAAATRGIPGRGQVDRAVGTRLGLVEQRGTDTVVVRGLGNGVGGDVAGYLVERLDLRRGGRGDGDRVNTKEAENIGRRGAAYGDGDRIAVTERHRHLVPRLVIRRCVLLLCCLPGPLRDRRRASQRRRVSHILR